MNAITITGHLRGLEDLCTARPAAPERFSFGEGGKYTIRVANDLEIRRKAYQFVYKLYIEKEYTKPRPSGMWLSIFDALPKTTTFLVERVADREAVGALTVVFDSPLGLPADGLYKNELDELRASGRRLAEVVSLGVAEEAEGASQILVKLFNFSYLVARRIRKATDFVITVNPRHANFYARKFFFAPAGPERSYGKVGGAPAMLLSIPLDTPDRVSEPERSRTLYRYWLPEAEEAAATAALARVLRPMSTAEIRSFLAERTGLLAQASPEERTRLQNCCRACELAPAGR